MHILCEISTRGRYDTTLPLAIYSVISQTRPPDEFVLFDDNEHPQDLRTNPVYSYLFALLDQKKIRWQVVFGAKKGQHWNHERAQEMATDLVWRIDDDEIAEPTCLQELLNVLVSDAAIGAVAGIVAAPGSGPVPASASTQLSDIDSPNIQWFLWDGPIREAQHLYSSFLYRKGLAHYDLSLSSVAHREETLFTHGIYRKGYKLFVTPTAVTWHLRYPSGGIRDNQQAANWEHDEEIFRMTLKRWGVTPSDGLDVVLDNGLGDHIVFKKVLQDLKKKHTKINIYCCYPFVFEDDNVNLLSIKAAQDKFRSLDQFNAYKFGAEHPGLSIEQIYREIY